jgi:hypothetical protein
MSNITNALLWAFLMIAMAFVSKAQGIGNAESFAVTIAIATAALAQMSRSATRKSACC